MTAIFTGDRRSKWGTWQGPAGGEGTRAFDDFTAVPPDARWDRSIRMRRFQGDFSQWIPTDEGSLSRAQLQGPSSVSGVAVFPMGVPRWLEWWVRFNVIAVVVSDDFHMYIESHTPSANPGGVFTGNLARNPTVVQLRRWVGPGAFQHLYPAAAFTALDLGVWHHYRVGIVHATGATGSISYYRDNVLLYSATNTATTTQNGNHYPEIGFYTYWSTVGTDDMNIAGVQVHDVNPGYPGTGGAPIDTTGLQVIGADVFTAPEGAAVHFANDPDRITPGASAGVSPSTWRRRGGILVPCDLPAPGRLVRV